MAGVEPLSTSRSLASGITVLHVDDDEQYLQSARLALEDEADIEEVVSATSTAEALAVLQDGAEVDCVVSDHTLEGEDSVGFLRDVREAWPNLPFIVFTGTGSERTVSRAISAGATNYVRKDTSDEQFALLATQIRNAVERRRVEMEVHRGFTAIEMAREGIALLTEDRGFRYVNEAFADLFGFEQDALVDRDWSSAFAIDAVQFLENEAIPAVDATGEWNGQVEGTRIGGERFVGRVTVSNVPTDGYAVVVSDVTERREHREELEEENERLDEFAGMVSHDLRNPLSVISVRLELAQESGDEEHFREIEDAVDRIDAITTDLLELVRGGETVTETDSVDLESAVEGAWDDADPGDATLVTEFDGSAELTADRARLEQLLSNLFRNALDHSEGHVTVRVGRLPDRDGFYVEDDGPGIPPARRDEIFDTGFSTSNSTGLGLSIVEYTADAHGWSVGVERGRDGGARFEFSEVDVAGGAD